MDKTATWVASAVVLVFLVIGFALWYSATTEIVTTNEPVLTCEQKIDKLTKEYVAVQAECNPVATSTQG